uniref:FRIGIDA-like protein n=1 Tax=Angiostrongylus cantonensis TaxID=6313 RepID=A0A0K0DNN8_ANGCA
MIGYLYGLYKNSVEEIKTSLRSLGEKCTTLGKELKKIQGAEFEEIRQYLEDHCYAELEVTNGSLKEMLKAENELAIFFCENKSSFKIEECLKENDEQERLILRKEKNKMVECDENKQKAESEQRAESFFAFLEKGHHVHTRRRIRVGAIEPERDRKAGKIPSLPKVVESTRTDVTLHDDEKSKQTSNTMSVNTNLRNSDFCAGVLYLNDYVEILEKQVGFLDSIAHAERIKFLHLFELGKLAVKVNNAFIPVVVDGV